VISVQLEALNLKQDPHHVCHALQVHLHSQLELRLVLRVLLEPVHLILEQLSVLPALPVHLNQRQDPPLALHVLLVHSHPLFAQPHVVHVRLVTSVLLVPLNAHNVLLVHSQLKTPQRHALLALPGPSP